MQSHTMKTYHITRSFVFMVCFVVPCSVYAQPKPIKWGEVPIEDLKMNSYPADTNASAIILCDYGDVWFTKSLRMVYERHTRIKILTNAGYKWGTVSIPFYAKDNIQKVKNINGQTVNITRDGKVHKHKLDKNSIFEEEAGEWKWIRFTLPALSPGAVIEYRYKIESKRLFNLPDWNFQTSEPTRWSEFRASIPELFRYVSVFQGHEELDLKETKPFSEMYVWFYKGAAAGYISNKIDGLNHRWVKKDAPAIRNEPFMTIPEDYRSRILFQLAEIRPLNSPPVNILNSWDKVATDLMDSNRFGQQIDRHTILQEQSKSIVSKIDEPEEKLKAIYDYVRTSMKWNGGYGVYCDRELDDAFKARIGSTPEINLILISMLHYAGLEVYPLIISTRDHGKIQSLFPMVGQFNSVLAYINIGEKEYFLDATSSLRPYNLLPEAALNHVGYLIDKINHGWINIVSPSNYRHLVSVMSTLGSDGSLSGQIQSSGDGYKALFDLKALKDKDEEDFVREIFLANFINAELDSFSIANKEEVQKPLMTSVYFSIPDFAQVAGDFIYLNPMIVESQDENPFKLPERTFPVDFAYERDITYTLQLSLPQGYTLQEQPKNIIVRMPNGGGEFRRVIQASGRNLSLMNKMAIKKPTFEPEEYQGLRQFYSLMVAAHAEQVVLKRATNNEQ